MSNEDKAANNGTGVIKHDIKNQLSNISLALEQLRYEIPDQNEDCQYYLDTILTSVKKINSVLDNLQH